LFEEGELSLYVRELKGSKVTKVEGGGVLEIPEEKA
jgi:hypothetical protein